MLFVSKFIFSWFYYNTIVQKINVVPNWPNNRYVHTKQQLHDILFAIILLLSFSANKFVFNSTGENLFQTVRRKEVNIKSIN